MTGFKLYMDDANGCIIAEPQVHWEGESFSKSIHPVNVVPYRKSIKLPEITFVEGNDDGDYGTHYMLGRVGVWP